MSDNTIQQALARSFQEHGEHIVMRCKGRGMTYRELDRRTEGLARGLVRLGYKKGDKAGIYSEAPEDFIMGSIAALRAGLIFVPIDAHLPLNRIRELAWVAQLDVLLAPDVSLAGQLELGLPVLGLSAPAVAEEGAATVEESGIAVSHDPQDPIYIYFTSGSTGTPHAVLGKNSSLLHFVQWEIDTFSAGGVRTSQLIAPGFDAFLRDIFVPLVSGGTVCIPPYRKLVADPAALRDWLNTEGIELVHCVPSVLMMLLQAELSGEDFPSLRQILLSGERINPARLEKWYALFGERIGLVNLYGATETTMIKLFYRIGPRDIQQERIPIGQPMAGARALILDQDMNICDEGTAGELYIRTPYGTFGYYNDPEMTRKKFVPNPFSDDRDDVIYKTGDLCKLRWDGNIDFIGRMDRQIKIRGIRIELEDIENTLIRHPLVEEAVVVHFEKLNDTLAAFIVSREEKQARAALGSYLAENLPDYSIPASIIAVPAIPRNANGKIAYNELMRIFEEQTMTAPKNTLEQDVYDCWAEILGHTNFGTNSSFFRIGGHSLNMLLLIHKLAKRFSRRLAITTFFEQDTIEKQALLFGATNASGSPERIPKCEKKRSNPLSSSQQRMYFNYRLHQLDTAGILTMAFEITGDLRVEALKRAMEALIARHAILRVSFIEDGDQVRQSVHQKGDLKFSVHSVVASDLAEQEFRNQLAPFDPAKPTQLQFVLFRAAGDVHLLYISCLDILCDGYTQMRIVKELADLYSGITLSRPKIDYIDYCEWQTRKGYQKRMTAQREFWKRTLGPRITLLDLPYDYDPSLASDRKAEVIYFTLNAQDDQKLIDLARAKNIPPNFIIHAFYSILLSVICNQQHVLTGMTVWGRNNVDLTDVLGTFINMVVLTAEIDPEKSFPELLQGHAEKLTHALDNQDYPFEELVKWAPFERVQGRNPLIDAGYIYRDFNFREITIPDLSIRPCAPARHQARHDLALEVDKLGDHFRFSFIYSTRLFMREKIEVFITYFVSLASEVLVNNEVRAKDLRLRGSTAADELYVGDLEHDS